MMMKKISITLLFVITMVQAAMAQSWEPVDKSPLDQMYFPQRYPSLKTKGTKEALKMRIIYSRPNKNNRQIFGSDIVPYGKVWRLGANEATEIQFFTDVNIGGKKVPKGRYTLYALVNENEWTYIINKETDIWGAFKYNKDMDAARVTVPVKPLQTPLETFTINFEKTTTGVNLIAGWDGVSATLPIKF